MKLVVGLGNPGKEYEKTRHNVGFNIINNYCRNMIFHKKFNGEYIRFNINNDKVLFLKPLSYMNLSGTVVKKFVDFYKISLTDILIIYDDMDISIGSFKLKPFGSSGGHNGMKSIIESLGTNNIKRLRIGISKSKNDMVDYVIGNFTSEEELILKDVLNLSKKLLDDYFIVSFDNLMNKYNKNDK